MTTTTAAAPAAARDRHTARPVVASWARAAVVAVLAVLAVLVHHETSAPVSHAAPASAPHRASGPSTPHHPSGPSTPHRASGPSGPSAHVSPAPGASAPSQVTATATAVAPVPVAIGDGGPCSGSAGQHCSAAGVDTVKILPPAGAIAGRAPARAGRLAGGPGMPGTVGRAPPDLSVLSRLLL
ncbi:hypothetical protein [Streptomyces sp. bgisy159]|uniref:hypothetical protein n=1 Tax=Streptomyces sp. bgisy159 TaxID=3413795 RepID=UPI003F49D289